MMENLMLSNLFHHYYTYTDTNNAKVGYHYNVGAITLLYGVDDVVQFIPSLLTAL